MLEIGFRLRVETVNKGLVILSASDTNKFIYTLKQQGALKTEFKEENE